MRKTLFVFWLALALPVIGAEIKFDFSSFPTDQTPAGFRSAVAGEGKPGDWKVIMDEVAPLLAPLTTQSPVVTRRAVLAQLSREALDEHFPLLIYEGETFGDFKLTTKFKTVGGGLEKMAGIAFRIQDEKNFYVVRASSLGSSFRFYKVVNGERGEPIGPAVEVSSGVWHELGVECKGSQIRCTLDGKEMFPPLGDGSFASGKVGFWTKSDSVSYFCDTRINYTPKIVPAQAIVDSVLKKYSRLLGLKVYAKDDGTGGTRMVASNDKSEIGQPAGETEQDVLKRGVIYCGFGRETVAVVMPLRDQNGDPVAAVRIVMKTFMGQTEQNAHARALPIIKTMQARVQSLADVLP
jgi:hypothetical protein